MPTNEGRQDKSPVTRTEKRQASMLTVQACHAGRRMMNTISMKKMIKMQRLKCRKTIILLDK
ncbi:MAG: hypothetical protein ACTSXP_17155 [Promethearchaeota archaeon]